MVTRYLCRIAECEHKCVGADALVKFVEELYTINEDDGGVEVCVDSGVSEGFQTSLSVFIAASSGTASELILQNRLNPLQH